MSNIFQNGFDNCLTMRLSNSDYWDLFLCYDCKDAPDPDIILTGSCLLINIDINDNDSYSGNTLYNLVDWDGATVYGSGVTLNDIGLTGIDNGFITYDCTGSTSGATFLSAFTGSTLFLSSADTRFFMTRVSGCTYDYTITPLTGSTEGRYSRLCGGFYQGFFKLSDQTFFDDVSDNMFTWPISWFNCPSSEVCTGITGSTKCCVDPKITYKCYSDKKPTPYNYQVLPTRYEQGWTSMFWLRKDDDDVCSGNTATTLNDVYSGNTGFFFYMGTRAENKFWDLFSGETGYTTTSGYPLPPPIESKEVLNNNPFLVYQPQGCCCFSGITQVTTQQRDRNLDIVNNALGFRIKSDGSIGYRSIGMSGVCSAVTATTVVDCNKQCGCKCTGTTTVVTVTEKWVTGTTVTEEYSDPGIIYSDNWIHISIRFRAYEEYIGCELNGVPQRKGRLDFYVNGFLKWSVDNFNEFLFKELYEYREKQQGVPFNYSWGGGSQGLIETNTVNGPDVKDNNLVIQENFAGTFEGDAAIFKLYGCSLDTTIIRADFENNKVRFGLSSVTVPAAPGIYYGKINKTSIIPADATSLTFTNTSSVVDTYVTLPIGAGYGYILIPTTFIQPSEFRDSNSGCTGFLIPTLELGEINITDSNGFPVTYNIYRTFNSFAGDIDAWMCS